MTYEELLDRIIETGIEGARESYGEGSPKFEGSREGFEACRGKLPEEIRELWSTANREAQHHMFQHREDVDGYWRLECKALEMEWTLNCLSAALRTPLLSWLPTARAVMHVARLQGVAS